jgi:hypothetical protein
VRAYRTDRETVFRWWQDRRIAFGTLRQRFDGVRNAVEKILIDCISIDCAGESVIIKSMTRTEPIILIVSFKGHVLKVCAVHGHLPDALARSNRQIPL